jgi:hypothetical protein
MKNWILLFLVIGAVMIFFGCQESGLFAPQADESGDMPVSLSKPAPNLRGEMKLDFQSSNPVWVGTIDFEGDEPSIVYGIRFYHLSPPKGYSQASPFEEYFEIYNNGQVYLAGPDVGVTTKANKPPDPCKYRMNGNIEVANAPFEMWLGRHVHMSGKITFQIDGTPKTADGSFRIN